MVGLCDSGFACRGLQGIIQSSIWIYGYGYLGFWTYGFELLPAWLGCVTVGLHVGVSRV